MKEKVDTGFVVILTSTNNEEEVIQIVQALLEEKLIACGKIIADVNSRYWWQGNIEEEMEFLVILKAHQRRFREIHETIKRIHSYQVPELIAIPIIEGAPSYLAWMKEAVNP